MSNAINKTKLKDITNIIGDGLHGTPIYDDGGNYYFINGNNLCNGKIVIKPDTKRVNNAEYEKYKKKLTSNTILISINGTLGNIAFYNDENIILGKSACYIDLKEGYNKQYIKHIMSTKQFKVFLDNHATGATIKNVPLKAIRNFEVNLPSNKIQNEIASILSTYDDLMEKNNRKIEILQEMAEELYKEWFVRFRFPGHENTKFIDGIPEGWEVVKLGDICNIITGNKDANQATGNGIYPFFTCARETTLTTDEYSLDKDAILVSGNGSYTGFVKKYSGKFDLYQRTYALYDFNSIDWLYVYWIMKVDFEKKHMGGTNGSAIPYITKPVLEKYKLLKPTNDLLEQASQLFKNTHETCGILEKQNENLKQQRDLLLPRLMSGKLEVKAS